MKTILIVSTLDTKGVETFYLKDKIKAIGKVPVILDISMMLPHGELRELKAEITPDKVVESVGAIYKDFLASTERSKKTAIMTKGAAGIALNMWKEGKLDGIIGIGGSTGSLMATDVMRALPFGVPKVMISSTAALPGMSTRYIDIGDIALMHSVVEISGLSDILKNVIDRAAYAVCGMTEAAPVQISKGRGKKISLAMSMLGPCEQCASSVRIALEEKGFQVTGFSAAGIGDRAMEAMIAQGLFDGVLDLAPGAVMEHLVGGMRDAGPERMEAAGKAGIPQIISGCGVNHITPPKSKYTEDHKTRRKYDLDKFRTWIRASKDEMVKAAGVFADKLNISKAPVRVILPLKGWSSVDIPGSATFDPEEDKAFTTELRKRLKPEFEIIEVDANMEEAAFAQAIVKNTLELFR